MPPDTSVGRYSAVVSLRLLAGGKVYALGQVGPDMVILKEPALVPPGPATVVTIVDGKEQRSEVIIPEAAGPRDIIPTRRVPSPVAP